jgi:protein-disulfide isomerase
MNDIGPEGDAETRNAACQAAVLRAFNELRRFGECDEMALRAALRVFAFHQPGMPAQVAAEIVEKWTRSARVSVRWSICVK